MSNPVRKEALDNCSSGQISFERSSNNFVSNYTKGVNTSTSLQHRCCSKPMTPRTSNKEKAWQMQALICLQTARDIGLYNPKPNQLTLSLDSTKALRRYTQCAVHQNQATANQLLQPTTLLNVQNPRIKPLRSEGCLRWILQMDEQNDTHQQVEEDSE